MIDGFRASRNAPSLSTRSLLLKAQAFEANWFGSPRQRCENKIDPAGIVESDARAEAVKNDADVEASCRVHAPGHANGSTFQRTFANETNTVAWMSENRLEEVSNVR
jgi:hypothetical protein